MKHYSFNRAIPLLYLPFFAMFYLPYIAYGGNMSIRQIDNNNYGSVVKDILTEDIIFALTVVTAWLFLAMITTTVTANIFRKKPISQPPSNKTKLRIFVILFLIGNTSFIIIQIMELPSSIRNPIYLLSKATAAALLIGLILWKEFKAKKGGFLIRVLSVVQIIIMAGIPIYLGNAIGSLDLFVVVLSVLLIARVKLKKLIIPIVILLIILALALQFKTSIRKNTTIQDDIENYKLWDQNYEHLIVGENSIGEFGTNALARVVSRLNHLQILILAIEEIPTERDYWGLKSYVPIAYFAIPRLLYADKPSVHTGNEFGREFKVIYSNNHTTSINLDPVTEAWISGGISMVIYNSIGFGLVFGIIFGLLSRGGDQWSKLYFFASVVCIIPSFESNLSLVIPGVLQSLTFALIFYLLHLTIKSISRTKISKAD